MKTNVDTAADLRSQGWTYVAIAHALGVTPTTARRWLRPDVAERNRQVSRAAKRRRRTPCPSCGRPVSYDRPGTYCAECRHEAEYGEQTRRIVEAWLRGDGAAEIALREGMPESTVRSRITRSRAGGAQVPRRIRRKRESWPIIEQRWNRDGWTAAQIARELGTNAANVYATMRVMRRAGVEVERRSSEAR